MTAADTTATSLVFIIYYCLENPRVWKRLCEEIRSKFAEEEDISGQSTASIPYLDAVIHEGTRMKPARAANLVRETPAEGMTIAGHFIPGHVSPSLAGSLTI